MTATVALPRPRAARKSRKTARPVREMLLEIAYVLHATKPVGRRPAAVPADR